jgi:hypothetical protein
LFAAGLLNLPLLLAGGLKIVYDLLLYRQFRTLVPPEERRRLDESLTERNLQ